MAAKKSTNKGLYSYAPYDAKVMKNNSAASGDYYGMGVKNPVGRIRGPTVGQNPVSEKGLKKPPKSLA